MRVTFGDDGPTRGERREAHASGHQRIYFGGIVAGFASASQGAARVASGDGLLNLARPGNPRQQPTGFDYVIRKPQSFADKEKRALLNLRPVMRQSKKSPALPPGFSLSHFL